MRIVLCVVMLFISAGQHLCDPNKSKPLSDELAKLDEKIEEELRALREDLEWERQKTLRLLKIYDRPSIDSSDILEQRISNLTDVVNGLLLPDGRQNSDDVDLTAVVKALQVAIDVLRSGFQAENRLVRAAIREVRDEVKASKTSGVIDSILEEINRLQTRVGDVKNATVIQSEDVKNLKAPASPCTDCGCTLPQVTHYTDRSPGYVVSTENAWPWLVEIQEEKSRRRLCGGSIIDARWVLTTAECVHNRLPDSFRFVIRRTNRTVADDITSIRLNKIFIHENYNQTESRNFLYDVALFYTEQDIVFDDKVHQICLPKPKDTLQFTKPGQHGVVNSYTTKNGRRLSSKLMQLQMEVKSDDTCMKMHALAAQHYKDSVMFCAGGLDDGEVVDTCRGDGGNPFVVPDASRENYFVQIGISSWGLGNCRAKGMYGGYTKLNGQILRWIKSTMKTEQ